MSGMTVGYAPVRTKSWAEKQIKVRIDAYPTVISPLCGVLVVSG